MPHEPNMSRIERNLSQAMAQWLVSPSPTKSNQVHSDSARFGNATQILCLCPQGTTHASSIFILELHHWHNRCSHNHHDTNPTDLQVTASRQWTLLTFEDILAALLSVSIICLMSKCSCGRLFMLMLQICWLMLVEK